MAVDGGTRGRIYLGGSNIPYDTTIDNATQLGQPMIDVEGLGAAAYFTYFDGRRSSALTWCGGTAERRGSKGS